jgi:CBS domain-containing protein
MKVRDVMTTELVTVTPDVPLKQAATLMLEHRISGLPVVDGERVIGVLSETDVLYKETKARDRQGLVDWIVHYGDDPPAAKLTARTAGEAMTSPAVTVPPGRSIADAATMLLELGIDRLPVVEAETLVGLVTRTDLVRAFARSDAAIVDEIRNDVLLRTLWSGTHSIAIAVEDGEVRLEGQVESETMADMIETFARRVPGVVAVVSHLSVPELAGVTPEPLTRVQ